MLSQIQLKNFKCFKKMTAVPLTGINLFTGINGRGKSTVLQALLLMRQSVEISHETNQLTFNGKSIELGNFNDVKNISTSKSEPIEFIYSYSKRNNHVELHYRFKANEEDDLSASIDSVSINGKYKNKDFHCSISREENEYIFAYDFEYNNQNVTNTSMAELAERKLNDLYMMGVLINFPKSKFERLEIVHVIKNKTDEINLECIENSLTLEKWRVQGGNNAFSRKESPWPPEAF